MSTNNGAKHRRSGKRDRRTNDFDKGCPIDHYTVLFIGAVPVSPLRKLAFLLGNLQLLQYRPRSLLACLILFDGVRIPKREWGARQ